MSPHSSNIKLKLLPSSYKKKRYKHMNNICIWFLPSQSTQPKKKGQLSNNEKWKKIIDLDMIYYDYNVIIYDVEIK
jgi:hypothetical protein